MSAPENKQSVPQTMKAVYYEAHGPSDQVLKFGERPVPQIKPTQVLVKVKAAGINPVDWKLTESVAKGLLSFVKLPHIVGYDVSGVVVEAGAEVKDLKVGDEVYSNTDVRYNDGTFAEYVAIDTNRLAKKPKNISFTEAAGVPLTYETANQVLKAYGLKKDDKVLVIGGGSACGAFGVQIAVVTGAEVATTCGTANVERVQQFGAKHVIDYSKSKWWEELKGKDYDLVFDAVGEADAYDHATHVLKKGGTFFEISSSGPSVADYPRKGLLVETSKANEELAHATQLFEQGSLKVSIDKVYEFNLEQVVEMFKVSKSGKAKGKLVVKIDN